MIKIIDLTNTYCANCDKKATHIHHIIPISVGGSNRLTNLVASCDDCHAKVHNLNFTDFHYLQRIGIAEAQAKGKHLGRPNAEYPNEWEQIYIINGTMESLLQIRLWKCYILNEQHFIN